ncbi:hypothetical protein NDU88_004777 [Pleurodeles waltl]|uniref:Secreted protein n=1 Tax=Pleurodeles waltl TaxID=8319 RepID=A0AAV7MUE8_PLEWA|nr:hypothetical protein NDU88_004777 [Pleurodeles waltl]
MRPGLPHQERPTPPRGFFTAGGTLLLAVGTPGTAHQGYATRGGHVRGTFPRPHSATWTLSLTCADDSSRKRITLS